MSDNCWKSAQLPGLQRCGEPSVPPSGTPLPLLRSARGPGRIAGRSTASRGGGGAALCGLRPGPAPPAPLRAPRRASPSAPHVPACGGPLLLAPPGRSRRCPLAGNGFSRPPSRTLPLLLPLVPSSPGVGVDAASREGSAAPPVRRRSLRTAPHAALSGRTAERRAPAWQVTVGQRGAVVRVSSRQRRPLNRRSRPAAYPCSRCARSSPPSPGKGSGAAAYRDSAPPPAREEEEEEKKDGGGEGRPGAAGRGVARPGGLRGRKGNTDPSVRGRREPWAGPARPRCPASPCPGGAPGAQGAGRHFPLTGVRFSRSEFACSVIYLGCVAGPLRSQRLKRS